jgi:hypothetical protein
LRPPDDRGVESLMNGKVFAVLAAVAAAFIGGRVSLAGDPPEKTVAAKRYKIMWAESGCDLAHGGGDWIQELFLPDAKVIAGLLFEYRPFEEIKPGTPEKDFRRARLYARASDKPRNDLTGLHGEKPSAIEDVQIPADLAKQIVDLAALAKRLEDEGLRLGAEAEKRLGMKRVE